MPEEKFARYDSADYLKTEEDIAAYLEAVMEDGGDDPAYVARPQPDCDNISKYLSMSAQIH